MNEQVSSPSWPSGRKQACYNCRQRKKKCDSVLPTCGLCARSRSVCLYSLPTDQNGLHQGVPQLHHLLSSDPTNFSFDRVLTNPIPPMQPFRDPSTPSSLNDHLSGQHDQALNHTGATMTYLDGVGSENSWGTLQSPDDSALRQLLWENQNPFTAFSGFSLEMGGIQKPMTPLMLQPSLPTPPDSSAAVSPSSVASSVLRPSRDQYLVLLSTCMDQCHSFLPCLDEVRLRAIITSEFERFQSKPLFWIIAACGERDKTNMTQAEAWLQRACSMIDENIKSVKEPLETLQALAYVVYHTYVSAAMVDMWVQLGKACRFVSLLGWDRMDGNSKPSPYVPKESSSDKEERRRVVWVIFMMDRAMSCMTGWPLGIDDRQFMVNYPQPQSTTSAVSEPFSMDLSKLIDSDRMRGEQREDLMGLILRGYTLLGRILTYHNNLHEKDDPRSPGAGFLELKNALVKFHLLMRHASQKHFQLSSHDRSREAWLSILIQKCTILLYHPTVDDSGLSGTAGRQDPSSGYTQCVNSVRSMIEIIKEDAIQSVESLLNPFLLPAYFLACRFLVINWRESSSAQDKSSIDIMLMLLDRIADQWGPLAAKYRKVIVADLSRDPEEIKLLRRGTGSYLSEDCRP